MVFCTVFAAILRGAQGRAPQDDVGAVWMTRACAAIGLSSSPRKRLNAVSKIRYDSMRWCVTAVIRQQGCPFQKNLQGRCAMTSA